ncbi:MAG: endonuclease/exonuclease/phosphatase family protein [Flavobacteriaceae bacterium]|jgi:predicted extracellular nuclease|nr:endonuclease/exonuclease/phosphatase family protein [Flavobacteriaceae bacterium]MBT4113246.1 endonuclease/exonuclease/phosphatase family protein [Flavobacteriaceae bacterium]MBT4614644.1 endonuclease/exonuclease/phosphatase family protein [Flavobacteriaceae bacterium]MBT5247125.1 endonuclease/exonuclease/phosphatase family protein [Flavobacteriaceae bacterium]MBT5649611.1 endonuclease/exonuclease/phosphatase family protein [Flavobacteriaceae bacterium]
MIRGYILGMLLAIISLNTVAQEKRNFNIHTIAFYNVENLFDTINDVNKNDEASPMMEIKFNRSEIYKKKVKNMAQVIADIGTDLINKSPSIVGLSEVENRNVIEDLINHEYLSNEDYKIVHYDSPDERGIDVGLIYNDNVFKINSTKSHELIIYDNKSSKRNYTRDQLVVSGLLDGELIHIIVNHWPSRSGGEERSRAGRMAAAGLNKKIIDSLQNKYKNAKIITMGDFNDDPHDDSMKKILNAKKYIEDVKTNGIYNPMEVILSDQGIGSNAYRDVWQLFDQILVTEPFLNKKYDSYQFYKAGVFNESYLINKAGKYKGYPFRSFSWGSFTDGYSDHLPSYIYLIKEIQD